MRMFVLATKVLPMLLALLHFVNTVLSYFYIDCVILNYIASIGIIPTIYLYFASYAIGLCKYYRMYLHYCVTINILNIIDYYIGIPVSDTGLYLIFTIITILFLFIILYLKFKVCAN